MSNKYIGFATTLKRGNLDGPPETFTAVAGIRVIDPPGGSTTSIEATTMDNPNAFKQFVPGLADAGELTGTLAADPADPGYQHLVQDWVNRVSHNWEIILSDGGATIFTVTGFILKFAHKAPIDGLFTV